MIKTFLRKYLSKNYPDILATFRVARRTWRIRRQKSQISPHGFKLTTLLADLGTYETKEIAFIKPHLEKADVLIDVGANVGLYTCMALSLGKYVVAIEPLLWNLGYLYFNLKENGWHSNLEVHPVGVSKQPGLAEFYGSGMSASLLKGWAEEFNAIDSSEPESQMTSISTLDILVGNRFAGKNLVVKMDVEGAEYEVLSGATLLLSMSPRPVWMVEIFSTQHHPESFNPHFAQLFELFWHYGYQAQDMDGNRINPDQVKKWVMNRETVANSNFIFQSS